MTQKIPPPPQLTGPQWQSFNRWLLEVTSVLSNTGGINPDEVAGLPETIAQVATNTSDIADLEGGQGGQGAAITALQNSVTAINGEIATINGQITTLSSRNQILNGTGVPSPGIGNNGDLFLNLTTPPATGSRLYGKIAGAWVALS